MWPRLVYADIYRLGAPGMKRTETEKDRMELIIDWLLNELASHWAVANKMSVKAARETIVLTMLKDFGKKWATVTS